MTKLLTLMALLGLSSLAQAEAPWENGNLKVSANGRYLQHATGNPFFWQGDTVWLLFQKMSREEAQTYFSDRKSKGYNVVQCILFQGWRDVNVYGDTAFRNSNLEQWNETQGHDPSHPEQYDFWDHVDFIVETAAQNGIYLAISPLWGNFVKREPVAKPTIEIFAKKLAIRFKNKPNIIWINGGSIQGDVKPEIWEALGKTIKQNDPIHLMTFHPYGRTQSSSWFNQASWLDFNMFTSGHRRYDQDVNPPQYGEDNWKYVLTDLAKTPTKPTLDGEPAYDDTPQGLHDHTQPYWTSDDVRRYAYWSVFAGACGHTYGHNSVRQVYKPSDAKPASGAKQFFQEAMQAKAAAQMQYLKNLMLSRPYFERMHDPSALDGDTGEKYQRVLVTKGNEYLMAYTYTGRAFKMKLGRIMGAKLNAWWFSPKTGVAKKLGTFRNNGSKSFDPPGKESNGNDWVLVLDDASKNWKAPGFVEPVM